MENNIVNAHFLNANLKPKYTVYRIDERYRYYYTIQDNQVQLFAHATSILDATMPTSDYLIKWYADLGYQNAKEVASQKADYGTFMHICFSDLLLNRTFDLATIPERIQNFVIGHNIDFDYSDWEQKIKDDLAAFYKFCVDFDVKAVAVEIPLVSFEHKFGGTIDAVIEMKVGSGVNGNVLKADLKKDKDGNIIEDNRKIQIAIIDWKSGRHGFYPVNAAQLHLYKLLWEDNFGTDFAIDKLYNFSPKDWNETPSYTLKDQTDSVEKDKIQYYLTLFFIEEENRKNQNHHEIEGVIDLDIAESNTFEITNEDLQTRLTRLIINKI
ncbi:MAG: hypothetical protein ABFD00_03800 [Chloroherpetonaceae bacterium]